MKKQTQEDVTGRRKARPKRAEDESQSSFCREMMRVLERESQAFAKPRDTRFSPPKVPPKNWSPYFAGAHIWKVPGSSPSGLY